MRMILKDIKRQGLDISCDTKKQNTNNMSVSNNGLYFWFYPEKNNGQSVVWRVSHVFACQACPGVVAGPFLDLRNPKDLDGAAPRMA